MAASESELRDELEAVRTRLAEAEEVLRAIRNGEVDALVVSGPDGEQIYTLQTAERPYRLLIEAMNEGAVTLNDTGLILFCNHCFAQLVERSPEEVVGSLQWGREFALLESSISILMTRSLVGFCGFLDGWQLVIQRGRNALQIHDTLRHRHMRIAAKHHQRAGTPKAE